MLTKARKGLRLDLRAALREANETRKPIIRERIAIEIDDRFVGDGYRIPTPASREAMEIAARTEALFLDPTYTAKAMAGLIAYLRQQRFQERETVLFWHTGGQVGLFA